MTSTISVLQGCNSRYGNRSQQSCVLLVSLQIHCVRTRMETYLIASASSHSEVHVRDSCDVMYFSITYLFLLCPFFQQDAWVNRCVPFKMDSVGKPEF